MMNRTDWAVASVLALALLTAPGCASSKKLRNTTDDMDRRIAAMESAIEGTDRRLDNLATETDSKIQTVKTQAGEAKSLGSEAMSKATAAQKAAQGKLIWSVNLTDDRIKFDVDKAMLSTKDTASLDKLVEKIKSYGKALYLEIEGHTDSTGGEVYNARLAEKRAEAVRDYLNHKGGIPLHAMSTVAYGESRPTADNSTAAGRAQNRRVVIRVLE